MEPRNENWKARCEAGFFTQDVMGTLGVSIAELVPGRIVLEMPFNAAFTQHHGFLHAGTVTTVLDSACGFAAFTLMPEDREVLTVEFKSNFLSPAKGSVFRFEGEVVKSGRTLSVTRGTAFADGVAISTMQATMMAVAL
ncbi:PaaI family thioesterase [Octadecabacter ascidiaceicola]|uniref:Thioesterase domain-containing protein n=1 Tax=Octadecabacter ascidiaceicola TaxID=1655543 RepID=A0A238K220_9RHOB|nr:PaaI family thioesterase [Octadecabacter ascidiaceicola]SMX36958.1 hypothetical protein OCA8868_01188 [Octadecabacter ascidiaceicola]